MKKQIINYLNYEIDEQGNVYNTSSKQYLKGSIGENGYRYYRLSKNGQKKMFYAHRLVAEHFIANPEQLPGVNHKDGNKLNNDVSNLEWISYSENIKQWHNISKKINRPQEFYIEDLPDEKWIPFDNYLISSYGRVRHIKKNNLLRPSLTCGYYKVRLSNNGLVKDYMVHKLVWQLFSNQELPKENEVIDHIDGNKLNNNIKNLRVISLNKNVYATLCEQKTNSSAKKVAQYDLNNNLIAEYVSAAAAARALGLDSSTISKVCRGQNKTHGGFIFKYI